MSEIDNLLHEDRTFPPSDEWKARAVVNDPGIYERAAAEPGSVLGGIRARAGMDSAVGRGRALEIAARGVVRRRKTERQRQLRGSTCATAPGAIPRRDHLGRRARRSPHADLLGSVSSGWHVRQRAEIARRQEAATASPCTCRLSPSWPSPCSRARASVRSTAWSSAVFAPHPLRTA